jgi:hypothetical protein
MSDTSCTCQRARSSTFIVCESLFPIRCHGEYYFKVPLRVLVVSTSGVSHPHHLVHPRCKSQPAFSESQPAITKVSRRSSGRSSFYFLLCQSDRWSVQFLYRETGQNLKPHRKCTPSLEITLTLSVQEIETGFFGPVSIFSFVCQAGASQFLC